MFEYNNRADSINNKEARATIQFWMSESIKVISDLANAERSIEIYKKNNQMTDLTADVQFYVDQMKEIQTKIVEMEGSKGMLLDLWKTSCKILLISIIWYPY